MFAYQLPNPRETRRKSGLNQIEFWTLVVVTQSGGSRYENGRNIPRPVKELLRLVHVEKIDLAKVKGEDIAIIEYLQETHADWYKSLQKAIRAKASEANSVVAEVAQWADFLNCPFMFATQMIPSRI